MSRTVPLVTLVILDGWGIAPPGPGNAVELARTPVFDDLWRRYPNTAARVRPGRRSACPTGQMGNSEVGHLTIGSGRILFQDLVRVSRAVEDGSLFENDALLGAFRARRSATATSTCSASSRRAASTRTSTTYGRCSTLARTRGWTSGRGSTPSPTDATSRRTRRSTTWRRCPSDRIATVVGRYYAMDRDKRWDRTDRALDAIVGGVGASARTIRSPRCARATSADVTDEFVEPVVLRGRPRLDPATDAAIVFNFRPDRARQLTQRLLEADVDVVDDDPLPRRLRLPGGVRRADGPDTLAETLSGAGAPPAPRGRDREVRARHVLLQRRRRGAVGRRGADPRPVAARRRELRPEAGDVRAGVAARVVEALDEGYGFCVVNFANPDMVGHTGVIPGGRRRPSRRSTRASATSSRRSQRAGGVCLVTADHGNAEKLLEDDGVSPHTAHTTNPVPLVADRARRGALREVGALRPRPDGPRPPRPRAACADDRHEARRYNDR